MRSTLNSSARRGGAIGMSLLTYASYANRRRPYVRKRTDHPAPPGQNAAHQVRSHEFPRNAMQPDEARARRFRLGLAEAMACPGSGNGRAIELGPGSAAKIGPSVCAAPG